MTKRPRKPPRSSSTVLVVDSDASARKTTRRVLELLGYRVLDAEDAAGAEQIARLYVGPIHLLVVEAELSGRSGQALADRLQSVRPELRVLFTSDRPQEEVVKQGQLGPRLPFLQKPLVKERLAVQLRRALNGLSSLSPTGKE